MPGHIISINTTIPNSSKEVNIQLDGKNLILTGANGCGKTRLIKFISEKLEQKIIHRNFPSQQSLIQTIQANQISLRGKSRADRAYKSLQDAIEKSNSQLLEYTKPSVTCRELESLVISYHDNKSIFCFFEAMRKSAIEEPKSAQSFSSLQERDTNSRTATPTTSNLFESYLVSNMTAMAYAGSKNVDNNPTEEKRIAHWFKKLDSDLQELFEDPTLHLKFDSKSHAFHIHQEDREPYRFQQLSSGFSSILSVYADLLTKIELRSISPNDVTGIVFIDEIDAHLHVSLQKKIFRFLTKSFPKVQFIITTHSPFVVSSVDDAVIYDLTKLQQVDDLSMYSYESILEGLFDVNPISKLLENKIIKLNDLANMSRPNIKKMVDLISEISPHATTLDSESMFFLKKAELVVNKNKSKARKSKDV